MKHPINTIGYHVVNGHPYVTVFRETDPLDPVPTRTYRASDASANRVVSLAVRLKDTPGYRAMLGTLGWTLMHFPVRPALDTCPRPCYTGKRK